MGAVVTCGVFTHCETECNADDVDCAMGDPRVFPAVDVSVLILPLVGSTFTVAAADFTDVVALNDATLTAAVL